MLMQLFLWQEEFQIFYTFATCSEDVPSLPCVDLIFVSVYY